MALAVLLFSVFFFDVKAQDDANFLQENGITMGIISTVFSISFLLLVYVKLCHSALSDDSEEERIEEIPGGFLRSSSGLERSIIDSLPFFTFSSLKGSKEGLECAVCLSKFEETQVLRLLPQCRHSFHRGCIDKWLESHSSCPLCRCKFDSEDLKNLSFPNSLRYHSRSRSSSIDLSEEPLLELFVEREEENQRSFRFNLVGSWLRKFSDRNVMHKLKHKIIVSDLIYRSRWSDANSSDLMLLNSEMLSAKTSKRFSAIYSGTGAGGRGLSDHEYVINEDILKIKEGRLFDSSLSALTSSSSTSNVGPTQSARSKLLVDSSVEKKRSMSEIISMARFRDLGGSGRKDEMIRKLWLPIAARTVQWFAGREKSGDWKRSPWNV